MGWIGRLIETRENLIATVGTSVKDKYLPYKIVVPLRVRQFYRDTGGRVLEVAPENEVRYFVSNSSFSQSSSSLSHEGKEDHCSNEKKVRQSTKVWNNQRSVLC
jgi:hypothetical protein